MPSDHAIIRAVPELPEVETVRQLLEPAMRGARFRRVIVNRPNLRIPFPDRFVERLRGKTVEAVSRRGKYLTVDLSSRETLIMHLGMSGWFHVSPTGDRSREADPHDHVIFVMSSGQSVLFNDPRRFGFMDLTRPDALSDYPSLRVMGPEPLSKDFDASSLARACRGKKISLKVAVLDQRIVAGLGNIYASEALHHARLSPLRKASTVATVKGLPKPEARRLAASIKAVLTSAIKRRESPYRSARFRVYERDGMKCLRPGCGGTIKRLWQAGRSTFYCAKCQH
jgi:formamidopyrimidine-DNA glycosylase